MSNTEAKMTHSDQDEYPEHKKLHTVSDKSQAAGEFLDWLITEQGFELCRYEEKYNRSIPQNVNIRDLLAKFYEIDQNKIENEKQAMLEKCRVWQRQEVTNGRR